MKTSVFLSVLCAGLLTSNAFAYDLSIKGQLSETVDGSNNYFLLNSPSGVTIKSLSAINLDILAQTPTTQYLLDAYYSYYKYFGPGAADTQLTWGKPAHATYSIDHTDELDKYHFAASWNRVDITTALLEQTGNATSHGFTDTYSVNAGVTRDLGRADTVSLFAYASTSSSTDPGFTPYFDFTSVVNWSHTLSQTTSLNQSVSFDWFSADNPEKSQRLFWKVLTGLNSTLSRRLSVDGHVGMGFVNAWQNAPGQSAIAPPVPTGIVPFQPLVGSANTVLWDVGLHYALLKTTQVSLTAAQGIFPTITGQLTKSELVALTLTHQINQLEHLSFLTQFTQTTSGQNGGEFSSIQTTKSDFFTASVTYGYRLARDWATTLSYTYRNTGVATSSTILFGLTYDFNVMGNPNPINVALKERTRERAQNAVGYVFPQFH